EPVFDCAKTPDATIVSRANKIDVLMTCLVVSFISTLRSFSGKYLATLACRKLLRAAQQSPSGSASRHCQLSSNTWAKAQPSWGSSESRRADSRRRPDAG